MQRLKHVVVARHYRQAATYAADAAWQSREWSWADSVEKLMGLTHITVYLMPYTFNSREKESYGRYLEIQRRLNMVEDVDNIRFVTVE